MPPQKVCASPLPPNYGKPGAVPDLEAGGTYFHFFFHLNTLKGIT